MTIVWGEKKRKWNNDENEQKSEPKKGKRTPKLRAAVSKAVKYLASEGAELRNAGRRKPKESR